MSVSPELLARYISDPGKHDAEVRQACGIPDSRYYTVSIWPLPGIVTVDKRSRDVPVKKISKSP